GATGHEQERFGIAQSDPQALGGDKDGQRGLRGQDFGAEQGEQRGSAEPESQRQWQGESGLQAGNVPIQVPRRIGGHGAGPGETGGGIGPDRLGDGGQQTGNTGEDGERADCDGIEQKRRDETVQAGIADGGKAGAPIQNQPRQAFGSQV